MRSLPLPHLLAALEAMRHMYRACITIVSNAATQRQRPRDVIRAYQFFNFVLRSTPLNSERVEVWRMALQPHPDSLLGALATVPDPRRRKGRRYPQPTLLGLVLLGMLHGHDSLRGA